MQTPRIPRCQTHFTLEVKCKVLSYLISNGNNISQCARDLAIERRYISRWNKQKQAIFSSTHKRTSFKINSERRKGIWPEMEVQLNEWILEKRSSGVCLTGKIIKSHALVLYHKIYLML